MLINKIAAALLLAVLAYGSADARDHHYNGSLPRPGHGTVTVKPDRPAPPPVTDLRNPHVRFDMAMSHLRRNRTISVKQYARMTGLRRDAAAAELHAFACDRRNPITFIPGRPNHYGLRR